MFCEFCRSLFELRQQSQPYKPPQNGLPGCFNPLDIPRIRRLARDHDRKKARSKDLLIDSQEDESDILSPRLLWSRLSIERADLRFGESHLSNTQCATCKMIFSNISESIVDLLFKNSKDEPSIAYIYQLKMTDEEVATLETTLSIWLEIGKTVIPMAKLHLMKAVRIPYCLTYSHLESTNTGSAKTLDLANSWLHECNETHRGCSNYRQTDRLLPSRLIDVGTSNGSQPPRLWTPEHTAQFVQYIALSYRWANSPSIILTKASESFLQKEIPMEFLPQSNQDAIKITRHLGIRYLWIDALCILQDSDDKSDWHKESARMGDIYKFAYVTISASQASTGKNGCFSEHPPFEARLRRDSEYSRIRREAREVTGEKVRFDVDSASTQASIEGNVSPLIVTSRKRPFQAEEEGLEDFVPMKEIFRLDKSEAVLEVLLRQEIEKYPESRTLRALYNRLRLFQCSRTADQTGRTPISELRLSVSERDSTLCLAPKHRFYFFEEDQPEEDELAALKRICHQLCPPTMKAHIDYFQTSPIVLDTSLTLSFCGLEDISLLSREERRRGKAIQEKLLQGSSSLQSAVYDEYQQLIRCQWQREYLRSKLDSDLVVRPLQIDVWKTEIDTSPLSHRAWTLQERLLSTRVLHFTGKQLFWECQSTKACETSPEPEVKKVILDIAGEADHLHTEPPKSSQLDGVALTPLEAHWEDIVEIYTDANLTLPDDKLVAISGVAKEIQKRTKDRYHAGLWGTSFKSNLLYYLQTPQLRSTATYRAPSWSWASVNGKVSFLSKGLSRGTAISNIQNICTFGTDGKRGSASQIEYGSFAISAPTTVVARHEKMEDLHLVILAKEFSEITSSADFYTDVVLSTPLNDAICVPVMYYGGEITGWGNRVPGLLAGLVVRPTGEFGDEYMRVGVFKMSESKGREWFEGMEWKTLTIV